MTQVSEQDRAGINPFAPLNGLLRRPMASYYLILVTTALLLGIGLMMVLAASSVTSSANSGSAYAIFTNQAIFACLGLVAFAAALRMPVRFFRLAGYPILILSLLALAALLIPGIGHDRNGAVRWIDLGPFRWQPSESAKLGLALWGADVLVRKRKLMADFRHLAVPLFPVAAVLVALVGKHDLGTSLCVLLVLVGLLWVGGLRLRIFGAMMGVALGGVIMLIAVNSERISRITSFMDPFAHKLDTGMQAVHGLYAISGGGFFGVGLGSGLETWGSLPEAYNDFIFAAIGEQLGFLGCLVVIGLYGVLAYTGLRIARRTAHPYVRLASAACTVWLCGQAFINMGAVVGLVPITGIPLPLISAGGSSLVLTLFAVGMLAGFGRAEPEAAAMLRERGPTLGTRVFGMPPAPPAGGAFVPRPRRPDRRRTSRSEVIPAAAGDRSERR